MPVMEPILASLSALVYPGSTDDARRRAAREMSLLGAQPGLQCQSCSDAIDFKPIGVVQTDRVLGCKSSKRIQAGEPPEIDVSIL